MQGCTWRKQADVPDASERSPVLCGVLGFSDRCVRVGCLHTDWKGFRGNPRVPFFPGATPFARYPRQKRVKLKPQLDFWHESALLARKGGSVGGFSPFLFVHFLKKINPNIALS